MVTTKKDGHTHTRFSHHGSQEPLDAYIDQAIALGFTDYVVTEHAPLPDSFLSVYTGPRSATDDSAMLASELTAYRAEIRRVKQKYQGQIRLHQGFEVDYLPGYEDETRAFLQANQDWIDEIVLSVHFMANMSGLTGPLDYDQDQLQSFFEEELKDPQVFFAQYFQQVAASIAFDTGLKKPVRIGHITLVDKYRLYFSFPNFNQNNRKKISEILAAMQAKGYELDVNAAGLRKEFCALPYPRTEILRQAQQLGIPLTYGSDAHTAAEVGLFYQDLAPFLSK